MVPVLCIGSVMTNTTKSNTSTIGHSVLAALILVMLTAFSTRFSAQALPSFNDDVSEDQLVESIIRAMTSEEILGQVFFLGYLGKQPSGHLKSWIEQRRVGGVKIFTRNVSSLVSLAASVREIQGLAISNRFHIPLLIATDQEGGWVRHIRSGNSVSPGNMALAAGKKPGDAFVTGYYLGMELRYLGINMNFAPTVDVYSNPSATVIGPRAFSSDPKLTGLMALAYFKGMQKAGVVCTAKHYPGHGDTDKDSHGYLPEVNVSFDTLWSRDLLPYRFLVKEGIPAIMSGHLAFPRILGNDLPATLSSYFLKDVLRQKLGFQGVVVTDDLEMYGVHRNRLDVPSVSAEALKAGNDMILLSHTPYLQDQTWNRLSSLMETDRELRERVQNAARRVLRMKLRYLKRDFPVLPDVEAVREKIPLTQAKEFFFDSSCRAVTLVRDKNIPFSPTDGRKILLVGQIKQFFREGLRRFPEAEVFEFPYTPWEWSRISDRQTVSRLARGFDTVIFCLTNQNSLEVLQELEGYKGRVYVISALTPSYLASVPWIESALAIYGMESDSFRAGFSVLVGDFEPEGTLPLGPDMKILKVE
jgi:beta-N-acetylhexosaminidase